MKAITLTQPWATLVATGAKRVETRSWRTLHRGVLLIHSAQRLPLVWTPFGSPYFKTELEPLVGLNQFGVPNIDQLPRGEILATVNVADVVEITEEFVAEQEPQELAFGNYLPGRFAWIFDDVLALDEGIPATGSLGLWNAEVEPGDEPEDEDAA